MDKASHSFPRWVLVIVGLSALWALYGCGGGGGGGGAGAITAVPIGPGITSGIISGAVTASGTIASILPSAQAPGNATDPGAALRAATVPVVGARVWSESSPQVSTVSNTAGNYTLSDLPFGYHRIVAQRVDGFGSAYKVRSNSILVNSDVPIVNSVNLDLMPASNFVQGTLQNLDGQPIPNAVMTLWGETFTSDANGYFRSPPLPAVIYAEQIRMTPGGSYEPMTLTVPFTAMPQALNIIAARPGENRAPIVTVTAGKVMVTPHETPIVIIASATDRDNEPLTYNWSWTDGSLATSSPYTARWTAPGTSGLATVTVTVRDPRGATGRASIGFTVGGGTVATNRAPTATMQATTSVVINQSIDLRVTASDPDFDPLTYSWSSTPPVGAFSSLTASSTRWTAPGTAQTVVINCRVLDPKGAFTDVSQAVIVWDGVNPPPNQAPVVTMLPPVGESYGTGSMRLFAATSSILLSATALDPETGEIPTTDPAYYSQYQWFLLRGATRVQIGTGPAYYVSNLPPGTYTAIVRVYDRPPAPQQPMYAEAQVLLRINTPPTMTLAAAPVRTDYPLRQVITFTATVFDPDAEDNPIRPGNFRWRFDGIDAGVVGATIATTPTVPGSYVVDVTYTDHTPAGVQVSRRLRFDVATNTAPVVTITAISPTQTSYLRGTPISFSGTGADWEDDANFGPQNLSWLIEGRPAGQGGSITVATFSEGDNRVTLMGVDSLGAVGYATTSVTIEPNQVPQMQLVSVTPDQPTYPMGTSITFVAAGTDREDTAAFGPASFTWWLDLNLVGSGSANLTIASIPTGVHTITVRGTDQFGGVGAASRTITVQPNNSPAMQIVTPGTGGTYPYGTTLTFIGAGTDIEDGVRFTPASYVWFDNDVEFARGVANPARTFATAGAHVIRLEGTDSQFGVGTTSVSLTVLDNNRPVMQILAPPPSNRVFALQPQNVSEPIQFIGSGTDVEDGAAFGPANFIWYSFNHYQSANATNAFRLGIANPLRAN